MVVHQHRPIREQRRGYREEEISAAREHPAKQKRGRSAEHNAREKRDRFNTPAAMQRRKHNVGAPLPSKPRLTWLREGEEILVRYSAMFEDVISRAYVPSGIPISKE
jgi:hypothetical protein